MDTFLALVDSIGILNAVAQKVCVSDSTRVISCLNPEPSLLDKHGSLCKMLNFLSLGNTVGHQFLFYGWLFGQCGQGICFFGADVR